jgi:hypothetical protein
MIHSRLLRPYLNSNQQKIALRANKRPKQRNEFNDPSQREIPVGNKVADKTTNLSVNHLVAHATEFKPK